METAKRSCETIRRIIAIFYSNVYNFIVFSRKFLRSKCKTAVSDIFTNGNTAKRTEYSLKMKSTDITACCYVLNIQILSDIFLNVANSVLNTVYPTVHPIPAFSLTAISL